MVTRCPTASLKYPLSLIRQHLYFEGLDQLKKSLSCHSISFSDVMIALYKELIDDYKNLSLRLIISDLFISKQAYQDAVTELQEIFDLDPHFIELYPYLNKIYRLGHHRPLIQSIFHTAFAQNIMESSVIDVLSTFHLDHSSYATCISFFKALDTHAPYTIGTIKTLAELFYRDHQPETACSYYQTLLDLDPNALPFVLSKLKLLTQSSPRSLPIREFYASLLMKDCQPQKALSQYEWILSHHPDSLSQLISQTKQFLSIFPDQVDLLFFLTKLYIQQPSFPDAISHLRQVFSCSSSHNDRIIFYLQDILKQAPDHLFAHHLYADVMCHENQFETCLHSLKQLVNACYSEHDFIQNTLVSLSQDPRIKHEALLLTCQLYCMKKDYSKARRLALSLVQSPCDLKARCHLVYIGLEEKNTETALSSLHALLAQYPFSPESHALCHEIYPLLYSEHELDALDLSQKGLHTFQQGFYQEALTLFDQMPHHAPTYWASQMLCSRGFLEMGRLQMAQYHVLKLSDMLPPSSSHFKEINHYYLSIIYILQGQRELSLEQFIPCLSKTDQFPTVPALRQALLKKNTPYFPLTGCCLSETKPYSLCSIYHLPQGQDMAIASLDFASIHYQKGLTYFFEDRFQESIYEFELAVQLNPQEPIFMYNLAWVLFTQKQFDKAHYWLEKSKPLWQTLDLYYLSKGCLAYYDSQFDLAQTYFHQTLDINPDFDIAHFNLGVIYFSKDLLSKSFFHFQKAFEKGILFFLIHRFIVYLRIGLLNYNDWIHDYKLSVDAIFDTFKAYSPHTPPKTLSLFDSL